MVASSNPKNSANRILISIGCDRYPHLGSLTGAEMDARNIFQQLTTGPNPEYSASTSVLLLSPDIEKVRDTLGSFLKQPQLDTLTFFFAGHGGVSRGSFYLCLPNSEIGKLSTTAIPLNQLFTIINELAPRHTNIIIDACESGGLVSDLAALLKPELIGGARTPSVSIFATAAADEYAGDTPNGGIGTNALLSCLRGEKFVQSSRPGLDLVDAGRVAAELVTSIRANQSPVVWGLNLFGDNWLAPNPNFVEDTTRMFELSRVSATSASADAIASRSSQLWDLYYSVPLEFEPRRMWNIAADIAKTLDPGDVPTFVLGLSKGLQSRAKTSSDPFLEIEVLSVGASLLLRSSTTMNGAAAIRALAADVIDLLTRNADELLSLLMKHPSCLCRGAPSDFFLLPIRVSRILGWYSASFYLAERLSSPRATAVEGTIKTAISKLVDLYAGSLFSLSDEQAPFLLPFLLGGSKFGWRSESELGFGCMFSSLVERNGLISAPNLDGDSALRFLERNSFKEFGAEEGELLARPPELLSVLLLAASLLQLGDVVDPFLIRLDHSVMNLFIPDSHLLFAEETIMEGRNHVLQIGHGIWKVDDFAAAWASQCVPQLSSDSVLLNPETRAAALLSSLVFPNRVAWFIST